MTAAEYVAGLREFASWVERNAGDLTDLDLGSETVGRLLLYRSDRKAFVSAVRLLGRGNKEAGGDFFTVTRRFGPIEVEVYTPRDQVCRRVVTGTREVTREVRDPDLLEQVPLVTVTETVEDVDWVCDDAIFATPARAEVAS